MFGDDSKLRLRKSAAQHGGGDNCCEEGLLSVPSSDSFGGTQSSQSPPQQQQQPPASYGQIKGLRKRRRRRRVLWRYCQLCWRGVAAAALSSVLSLSLLPRSWHAYEVDYRHQVQHEIEHLVQVLEDGRRNTRTVLRGGTGTGGHLRHKGGGGGSSSNSIQGGGNRVVITCGDGMTIGFENDDYCDCPDGRDEPKTSACSHLLVGRRLFLCGGNNNNNNNNNSGKVSSSSLAASASSSSSVYIFASRVGDGIVDCPDGSDEKGFV